ncbi:hypothetical protein NDR87_36535 [Nocardia sp. CDC159]|uniref:Uncharacterized protein n=1 Tax=Nocardia pulmonis TaxID=2951408 RepID=A0A9X2J3D0_9NOCA|nr:MULTISPECIES: hypothetical protein [Nocardia]MCM6778976.1 hypothetical protein [Nocardia pulmonis]MCM6791885.1 hypothetical protein [Nocardia sp. CDC159]
MRKVIVAAAMLLAGAVVASSCASTQTAQRPVYPKFLSAQAQETIAYLDTLRRLDPCGYLDDAVLQQIGTPDYIGPLGNFDVCQVDFTSPLGHQNWLNVAMLPRLGRSGTSMLGKVDVTPRPPADDSLGGCSVVAALDPRLEFMVNIDGVFKTDMCPVAQGIAQAAVQHWPEGPLRAASHRAHVNSRLATLDPCAVLGKIGQGHHPVLESEYPDGPGRLNKTAPSLGMDAWNCSFVLDNDAPSTAQHIGYRVGIFGTPFGPKDSYVELEPGPDGPHVSHPVLKEIEIGGLRAFENPHPARLHSYPDACSISVLIPPQPNDPVSTNRKDPYQGGEVITIKALNGCNAAHATADEIVRLYNQLPS